MFSTFFKLANSFNTHPNQLIEVNRDYNYDKHCFGKLSKTNVFIGENNSGKSRFLRTLYSSDFYAMTDDAMNMVYSNFDEKFVYGPYVVVPESPIEKFNDLYKKVDASKTHYSDSEYRFFGELQRSAKLIDLTNKFYFPILRGVKDYKRALNKKLRDFLQRVQTIQNKESINHYISLLNLQSDGWEDFDIYREIINQEYFKDDKNIKNHILTGGSLYSEIKKLLLGDEEQRCIFSDFQSFLKDNFFSDFDKFQLIPNETEKVVFVNIGRDEKPIFDWGDGTQQLIVMLFYMYVNKDKEGMMFFIEEPEMYLHPGVLRKFIEVINGEIFKHHQYFITTHSNIILDTSADTDINMSIFKFKKVKDKKKNKDQDFLIEQCNNGDVSLLNELGVRNSSLFLSNCSIWVEGITDRLYLKHYLKLYCDKYHSQKPYRENIEYTFIEFGGCNIIHYNFDNNDDANTINAKYISNKLFLIVDNDNTKEGTKKAKRKEIYREQLKDNFYELPVVEIENLITLDTLKKVLISQNPEQREIIEQTFIGKKSFKKQRLGKFIDELFPNKDIKQYAAESGTIKNKLNFCNSVIDVLDDYDKLSDDAKLLTEKLYMFIETNNKD